MAETAESATNTFALLLGSGLGIMSTMLAPLAERICNGGQLKIEN